MLSPKATNLVPPSAVGGGRSPTLGGTGGGSWETVATIGAGEVSVGAVGDAAHADADATINAAHTDRVHAVQLPARTRPTRTLDPLLDNGTAQYTQGLTRDRCRRRHPLPSRAPGESASRCLVHMDHRRHCLRDRDCVGVELLGLAASRARNAGAGLPQR